VGLLGNTAVLRCPGFDDRYVRTSSPVGSDVMTGSSRSDSPSTAAALYDIIPSQIQPTSTGDAVTAHPTTQLVGLSVDVVRCSNLTQRDLALRDAAELLLTAAQPFVSVTSRTCSPLVVTSRPVSGPPRQFITSPPAPTAMASVSSGYGGHTLSSVTAPVPGATSVSSDWAFISLLPLHSD